MVEMNHHWNPYYKWLIEIFNDKCFVDWLLQTQIICSGCQMDWEDQWNYQVKTLFDQNVTPDEAADWITDNLYVGK